MGGIAIAWLFGEGILVYRWWKAGAPPPPGALLLSSGVYASLAVLAQSQQARTFATTMAWGYNLAILLNLFGQGKVSVVTNWPPPMITDQTVILPNGHAHGGTQSPVGGSNPTPGTPNPNSGTVPSGPNTSPPGSTPPPNQGVIFPPGSSVL